MYRIENSFLSSRNILNFSSRIIKIVRTKNIIGLFYFTNTHSSLNFFFIFRQNKVCCRKSQCDLGRKLFLHLNQGKEKQFESTFYKKLKKHFAPRRIFISLDFLLINNMLFLPHTSTLTCLIFFHHTPGQHYERKTFWTRVVFLHFQQNCWKKRQKRIFKFRWLWQMLMYYIL